MRAGDDNEVDLMVSRFNSSKTTLRRSPLQPASRFETNRVFAESISSAINADASSGLGWVGRSMQPQRERCERRLSTFVEYEFILSKIQSNTQSVARSEYTVQG